MPEKEFLGIESKNMTKAEKRQFAFCYGVFKELGFFAVKKGLIVRDYTVKKPLEDSALFRKVRDRQC